MVLDREAIPSTMPLKYILQKRQMQVGEAEIEVTPAASRRAMYS